MSLLMSMPLRSSILLKKMKWMNGFRVFPSYSLSASHWQPGKPVSAAAIQDPDRRRDCKTAILLEAVWDGDVTEWGLPQGQCRGTAGAGCSVMKHWHSSPLHDTAWSQLNEPWWAQTCILKYCIMLSVWYHVWYHIYHIWYHIW